MENRSFIAEVRAKDNSRVREFIASTYTRDRHGTVLNQANWDLRNFNKNGISGYMHDVYGGFFDGGDPDNVLGPTKAWIEGDKLIAAIDFETEDINPKAEKILKKVDNGTLKAVSVGFKPIENKNGDIGEWGKVEGDTRIDKDTFYYFGQELLEISVVNIPSNPDAVKRGIEMLADITDITKRELPEKPIEDNTDKTTDKDIEYNYMESVQIQINENIIRL